MTSPSRRRFLHLAAGSAALPAISAALPRVSTSARFDVVLRGGTVLDGTGAPGFLADVAIRDGRIAAVDSIPAQAAEVAIDAGGLHIAPGFIDVHSHSDGSDSIGAYPTADSRVRQGITTEVTGNCGDSAALERAQGDESDVEAYMARLEALGISVNHALLLGQGTLRDGVIGPVDREATGRELRAMQAEVERGMDAGALGLSTGLEYTPGSWTSTEELTALARVVGRRGGVYASHIRDEEARLLAAVSEAIEIGRGSGARVQVSHLKAGGKPNWPMQAPALHLIESARRSGTDVLADAYPYTAYSTGLAIMLDDEVKDGGTAAMLKRLADPAQRAAIRAALTEAVLESPGSWDLIVISSLSHADKAAVVGKSVAAIAAGWSVESEEAALRLIEMGGGNAGCVGHGMSTANVERVLAHPLVMIGSDGSAMAPTGKAATTRPHPRSYGTFPRVLGHFCRERELFDLQAAVKKMTSMPADQFGLARRGRIARGMVADLVVFDAGTVADVATFEDPHRYPVGIPHVLVAGTFVVKGGEHTGARPGRVLRKA